MSCQITTYFCSCLQILECFLQIRANALYHVGFPSKLSPNEICFSPYLAVDHRDGAEKAVLETPIPPPTGSPNSVRRGSLSDSSDAGSCSPPPEMDNCHHDEFDALDDDFNKPPPPPPPPIFVTTPSVTHISLKAACKLIVCSLKKEKGWLFSVSLSNH